MAPKVTPSSSSSTKNIDEALGMLCSATADLRNLESSLLSTNTISLQWCCQAIHFLKTMHSHFCIFTEKSENPTSFWKGGTYLNLYMEETLSLLDLLNLLKLAISGIVRYSLIADFAVQKLLAHHELPTTEIKGEIVRLEGESRQLYGVDRWKDIDFSNTCSPKTETRDPNVHVAYVFRTIMAVISTLLFSLLFYPVSVKLDQEVLDQFPQMKSISTSLQNLVSVLSERLHEIKDHSRSVLVECKMTERAVMHIKAEVLQGDAMDNQKGSDLLLLLSSSVVLRDSLQLFENEVNEFFDELTRGRNRLLALFQQDYQQ